MPITRLHEGSHLAQTADSTGKTLILRLDDVSAVLAVDTSTTRVFAGGNSIVIQATIGEIMALHDSPPVVVPPVPPPEADLTGGKLRISPQGNAIARQLTAMNPKGDWVIVTMNGGEVQHHFTTIQDNPEISDWPYLTTVEMGT